MKYWKIGPDNFKHSFQAENIDDSDKYEVFVRSDGCVDLIRIFAGDEDCIHICDLDDFIKRLQELKSLAANYFNNEEWQAQYTSEGKLT